MHRRGLSFRPVPAWLAIAVAAAAGVRAAAAGTGLQAQPVGDATTMAGAGLGGGDTLQASAEGFMRAVAAAQGIDPADLAPVAGGRGMVSLQTRGGTFWLVTYQQWVRGIGPAEKLEEVSDRPRTAWGGLGAPVFEGELRVLIRDQPGNPVVLARSSLRPVKETLAAAAGWPEIEGLAAAIAASAAGPATVEKSTQCAWVTPEGRAIPAVACMVRRGRPGDADYARRLVVIDGSQEAAERNDPAGLILVDRDLVVRDARVHVSGLAAADCLPAGLAPSLEERPLAHARLTSTATGPLYADDLGTVVIPDSIPAGTVVTSTLRGRWFRVASDQSMDLVLTGVVSPGGDLSLTHNAGAGSVADTAQVNAYVAANEARDWALALQPGFPGLDHAEMPLNVGLASTCNAFYDGSSLNFFRAGSGCADTAYCSVVHHEYGHHLVHMAGSGQGPYGEGFADVVAMLIRDDPGFAYGYHNDPAVPLRSGENTLRHPCTGDTHTCGMVLSGAVWETRNLLALSHPDDHNSILAQLMLASVFLHTGADLSPQIVIDLLTLDDDDHDIFNGTPHYGQIAAGFAAHGLEAPPLPPAGLRFPGGLPGVLSPQGATFIAEEVQLGGSIASLELFIDIDDAITTVPLEEVSPGRFAVAFPLMPCGAQVEYSFELTTDAGAVVVNPMSVAPAGSGAYRAVIASEAPDVLVDDMEQDGGWAVAAGGGLTDGTWQRGVPAALGDRGDPLSDYDGSGQCWLTANRCCNSDVDNGFTVLTSPAFDVSGALAGGNLGRVELAYARWFSNETTGAPRDDVFLIEISGDGGQSWVPLETVGPEGPEVSGGWLRREFIVSELTAAGGGPLITAAGTVHVRFTASDAGIGSIVEAAVDAIQVRAFPCGAVCACERDGDVGQIDVFDLLVFLDDWFAQAAGADVTGDGAVDILDILAYLDCWFEACG